MKIPFSIPYTHPESIKQVQNIIENPFLINIKHYTKLCAEYFEQLYPGYKALMTPSCTKALEIIAISLDFKPGEEIIMPSFNFVGVGNAFVLHGATLVFGDIDPNTMNITAESIRNNITPNTKAVLVMHYAGVGCEMEEIVNICKRHNLVLIEDNAQGINCRHNNHLLGSFGDFSVISFDSMKNVSCSEGGLILYKEKYHSPISTTFHLGTNREDFEKGLVSHYEWVAKGSKFSMSEYNAAVLYPLLVESENICRQRREMWDYMFDLLYKEERLNSILSISIRDKQHNGHIFWIKCKDENERNDLMKFLDLNGIPANFHYTALHNSKFIKINNTITSVCPLTDFESQRILRLPIFNNLSFNEVNRIVSKLLSFYKM
jgi:dTDP-4-amino-4,6-dideoxygalactose transaminase